MKILYYNWVDYRDPEKRGGGVSVYQRNLMEALRTRQDVQCTFITSGISYDLTSQKARWEPIRHTGDGANAGNRFEIVNSGVLSPGHHSFGMPAQIDDPETAETFFDFIARKGPFDIVHFNNLEGLPASALAVRERFPNTRVVYSLHNYYPMCPQVNLWHKERENCVDYSNGRKCETCLIEKPAPFDVRQANAIAYVLKKNGIRPGSAMFDRLFGRGLRIASLGLRLVGRRSAKVRDVLAFGGALEGAARVGNGPLMVLESPAKRFRNRREQVVAQMNASCDRVLCVSQRVRTVATRYGVSPELLETLYIGSPQAEKFAETEPRPSLLKDDGTLTLGYLGYMRRDKGFYFLLDALDALPMQLAERIHLVICARRADKKTMRRVTELGDRFASVRYADGYSHDQLDSLLADVDVGVVPVLWEDNLPQVAIEMHARHIPLLTSNLGGARELGNFPPMVFEAGDVKDFHAKIKSILNGWISARSYWRDAMAPVSMKEHVDALLDVYQHLMESGEQDVAAHVAEIEAESIASKSIGNISDEARGAVQG